MTRAAAKEVPADDFLFIRFRGATAGGTRVFFIL